MSIQDTSPHWARIFTASNARAYRNGVADSLNAIYEELSATLDNGNCSYGYMQGLAVSATVLTNLLDETNRMHMEHLRKLNRSYFDTLAELMLVKDTPMDGSQEATEDAVS